MPSHDAPTLKISPALFARLEAFFPVMEAVFGENAHPDELPELAVSRGLDALLSDVIQPRSPESANTLLDSYIAMSRDNPKYVYAFVIRMIREGSGLAEWWRSFLGQPE